MIYTDTEYERVAAHRHKVLAESLNSMWLEIWCKLLIKDG